VHCTPEHVDVKRLRHKFANGFRILSVQSRTDNAGIGEAMMLQIRNHFVPIIPHSGVHDDQIKNAGSKMPNRFRGRSGDLNRESVAG